MDGLVENLHESLESLLQLRIMSEDDTFMMICERHETIRAFFKQSMEQKDSQLVLIMKKVRLSLRSVLFLIYPNYKTRLCTDPISLFCSVTQKQIFNLSVIYAIWWSEENPTSSSALPVVVTKVLTALFYFQKFHSSYWYKIINEQKTALQSENPKLWESVTKRRKIDQAQEGENPK